MKPKLYKSKAYLELMFIKNKKSIEEIAKANNVSLNTIRSALKEVGFLK